LKIKAKSYPDQIRRIAGELSQLGDVYGVQQSAKKLRLIASELEENLKKAVQKKA
jgi:hypothetical protein